MLSACRHRIRCFRPAWLGPCPRRRLDGDTIEVLHNQHPERIRLSGIDCPEKGTAILRADCSRQDVCPASCPCEIRSWDCDNRQRVILIVHLRHNTIPLLDLAHHLGSSICFKTYFLAVLLLDEIGAIFHAQHVALDDVDPLLQGHFLLISLPTFPFRLARFHFVCRRSSITCLCCGGQPKAQQETTRRDTDDFRNRYHLSLLG